MGGLRQRYQAYCDMQKPRWTFSEPGFMYFIRNKNLALLPRFTEIKKMHANNVSLKDDMSPGACWASNTEKQGFRRGNIAKGRSIKRWGSPVFSLMQQEDGAKIRRRRRLPTSNIWTLIDEFRR